MVVGGANLETAAGDILVVDDEPDIRESLVSILESAGYRVRTCANGKEAVAAIERARPALILLDLMMPIMNGWQVVEWVKRCGLVSTDQVMLMSASREVWPVDVPHLPKPFEIDELLRVIRERV
jgi:CheY-like chemotaxis protein